MKTRTDKPTGARAGWRLLKTKCPYKGKVFTVRRDKVQLPGGRRRHVAYLERSSAVIIVPVTARGEIVLINHYR